MFRWTTAQPLPAPLLLHLDQCGGFRVDWEQRQPGVVLIYLAPHQLLSQARLPLEALELSTTLSLRAAQAEALITIHGERLLQCDPQAMAQWVPGQTLPCNSSLAPPAPLEAAIAAAVLRHRPNLAASYEQLEALAERGGGAADLNYSQRLDAVQAEGLVVAWNNLQTQRAPQSRQAERMHWGDLESERQQIAAEQTRLRQQLDQRKQGQQLAADLLQRCQNTIARLLSADRESDSQTSAQRTSPRA